MTELEVAAPSGTETPPETVVAVVPLKKSASARAVPEATAKSVDIAEVVAPKVVAPEPVAAEPVQAAPAQPMVKRIRLPDAAVLKDGAEKVRATVSKVEDYSKENFAAVVASFEAANKGATALRSQSFSLTKSLLQNSLSSAKTLSAAKTLHDVTDVYRQFAKFALDTHLTSVETLTETVSTSIKDAFTPLKARVDVTMRLGQKAAA